MGTWLLIVVTTLSIHSNYYPSVITFQEFKTKERCEQMRDWINSTYGRHTKTDHADGRDNDVVAQCVPKEGK